MAFTKLHYYTVCVSVLFIYWARTIFHPPFCLPFISAMSSSLFPNRSVDWWAYWNFLHHGKNLKLNTVASDKINQKSMFMPFPFFRNVATTFYLLCTETFFGCLVAFVMIIYGCKELYVFHQKKIEFVLVQHGLGKSISLAIDMCICYKLYPLPFIRRTKWSVMKTQSSKFSNIRIGSWSKYL